MSGKVSKFLKNFKTLSEDKAIEVLDSLNEQEIESLCESANKLDEETKVKLVEMLDKLSEKVEEPVITETAAAETLSSKTNVLANAVGVLSLLPANDLSNLIKQAIEISQHHAESIPDDAAAVNRATLDVKAAVKEDLDTLVFEGSELSEETRFKLTTIFESAVNARVALITTELEEKFQKEVESNYEATVSLFTESTDKFLTKIANDWLRENELQVEHGLREEITSTFIGKLHNLMTENFFDIPESKYDVVELLGSKVSDLEEQLDEAAIEIIDLKSVISESAKKEIIEKSSKGLTLPQIDSLKTMAESIDFTGDIEDFSKKLDVLKESNFSKSPTDTKILTENFEGVESDSEKKSAPKSTKFPEMEFYASGLKKKN